jgi:hypothetical protein
MRSLVSGRAELFDLGREGLFKVGRASSERRLKLYSHFGDFSD